EFLRLKRAGRKVERHANVLEQRPGQFQHAFEKLNPLLATGDAHQICEERAVKRMTRAEDEELVERWRRRRSDRLVVGRKINRDRRRAKSARRGIDHDSCDWWRLFF